MPVRNVYCAFASSAAESSLAITGAYSLEVARSSRRTSGMPPAIQFADASGISTLHGSIATLAKDLGSPLQAATRRKMEAAAISVAGRLTQAKVENR